MNLQAIFIRAVHVGLFCLAATAGLRAADDAASRAHLKDLVASIRAYGMQCTICWWK